MTIGQRADRVDKAMSKYGHNLYADEAYIDALWDRAQSEVDNGMLSILNVYEEVADRVALMVIAAAYGKRALLECLAEETLRIAAAKDGN